MLITTFFDFSNFSMSLYAALVPAIGLFLTFGIADPFDKNCSLAFKIKVIILNCLIFLIYLIGTTYLISLSAFIALLYIVHSHAKLRKINANNDES